MAASMSHDSPPSGCIACCINRLQSSSSTRVSWLTHCNGCSPTCAPPSSSLSDSELLELLVSTSSSSASSFCRSRPARLIVERIGLPARSQLHQRRCACTSGMRRCTRSVRTIVVDGRRSWRNPSLKETHL